MNRSILPTLTQGRAFDVEWIAKDAMLAIGGLQWALAGTTTTVLAGFGATPTGPASLTINLAQGQIFQQAQADATPYGGLPIDTTVVQQQGYAPAQQITLTTAALSAGQSQWILIEAAFAQVDVVRAGDPTGGLLYYYNSANPLQPFQGPGNDGLPQSTEREGTVQIKASAGLPATTGSETPPNPDSGFVPMYLIDLTFGQTAITSNEILIAGPSVGLNVSGAYPQAPFIFGLLGPSPTGANSHHLGIPGHAPKVNLQTETQGILPFANFPTISFGSFINKFRNATCQIASRGTTISGVSSTPVYTLDGFLVSATGNTVTVAQAGSIGLSPNSLQITGQAGVTDVKVFQVIESLDSFGLAGQTVTFQCKILNNTGAGFSATLTVKHGVSPDTWSSSTTDVSSVTLPLAPNGQTTTLFATFTLPSGAQNGVSVSLDFSSAVNGTGKNFQLSDWDIRVANGVASPELRAFFIERLQCQRHLPAIVGGNAGPLGVGGFSDSSHQFIEVLFNTPARAAISGIAVSAPSDFAIAGGGEVSTCASIALGNISGNVGGISGAHLATTSSGWSGSTPAQGWAASLVGNTSTASIIFTGAELNGAAI